MRSDGLILTNAHVVKDAQSVTVLLADRREYTAQVLGSDAATDIAVLRIPAQGLQPVQLGDPTQLQVGDAVLAIGAPYGLEIESEPGAFTLVRSVLPALARDDERSEALGGGDPAGLAGAGGKAPRGSEASGEAGDV